MTESVPGRRGRAGCGSVWRVVLAVLALGAWGAAAGIGRAADVGAAEAGSGYTCIQSEARFTRALEVDLFGNGVVGRFGNSLAETYLAVLTTPEVGFQRVAKWVDGFVVSGEYVLAWGSDPGKLVLLQVGDPARPVATWQGSVARVEAAEPRVARGRVWWLTESEGELRAAWSDIAADGEGLGAPRRSPRLPVTNAFSMAFSARAALLQTTDLSRSWLWHGEDEWIPQQSTPTLRVMDAAGASFVAWEAEAEEWRVAETATSGLEWRQLFPPTPAAAPTNEPRFYAAEDGVRATFVEPVGALAMRLTSLGPGPRSRTESVEGAPLCAAFDGHRYAVIRDPREKLLELELCSRPPVAWLRKARPAPSAAPADPSAPPSALPRGPATRPAGLSSAGARALAWLEARLGPMLDLEDGKQGRLIDSYEDDQRAGWVYDAALAVIAFSASGRQDLARQLLVGLESMQHPDGSWSFAFHPDRGLVLESDRYVGSIAWVVMAANFYEYQSGDDSFSGMAVEGLRFIERYQSKDRSAHEFGGVAMGPGRRDEFSAEHNADSYSAFLWRGRLERDGRLRRAAGQIRRFVLATLWSEFSDGEGGRYFKLGARDGSLYLDPQTWLTLSLGVGADEPGVPALSEGLRLAERHLKVQQDSLVGFNEGRSPDIGSKIWPEGTEGMVAALRVVGQRDKADFYHRETAKLQTTNGGIPYATENSDGWSTEAAVASTAWFLLNELDRNPFRPAEPTKPEVAQAGATD